jgi:hypothetical protein
MSSEKISSLTPHTPAAGDLIPVADGGANYSDTVGAIESQAAALVVNITGTAANLSGTPALPNGTTGTTQTTGDNTTKLATDAFVHASIAAIPAETWSGLTGSLTETQVIPFDGPTPGTADTWISRSAAGTVAIGATSTPGNASGTLECATIYAPVSVNPQSTSTNYTAVLADADQLVTTSSAVATFTVPAHATVVFPIGTTLSVAQIGATQVTLTPASGAVTINTPSSLTTRAQYSTVSVVLLSDNGTNTVWLAMGDLT